MSPLCELVSKYRSVPSAQRQVPGAISLPTRYWLLSLGPAGSALAAGAAGATSTVLVVSGPGTVFVTAGPGTSMVWVTVDGVGVPAAEVEPPEAAAPPMPMPTNRLVRPTAL